MSFNEVQGKEFVSVCSTSSAQLVSFVNNRTDGI